MDYKNLTLNQKIALCVEKHKQAAIELYKLHEHFNDLQQLVNTLPPNIFYYTHGGNGINENNKMLAKYVGVKPEIFMQQSFACTENANYYNLFLKMRDEKN